MSQPKLTRRTVCSTLAGAAGLTGLGSSAFAAVPAAVRLSGADLAPLKRFMKVYASLAPGTLWYWYSGVVELALEDAPIKPLVGVETLIRREVTITADANFTVVSSEANYFHGLDDPRPLDMMINPVTGRTVQPLHFSEGPRSNIWTEQSLAPRKTDTIQTSVSWRDTGLYTWLYRTLHADALHPLDMKRWPLEASGARSRTGSFSTHCALTRDVADPALANAPCSFTYEAIFGWFPWLLMGQRPGQLLWRATGMKLPSLADLPEAPREGFQRTFPAIFTGGGFGPEGVNLWERYRATRAPAKP